MENSKVSLKGREGCKGFSENFETKITLGDFVAWNLATFDAASKNEVGVVCKEEKEIKRCDIHFTSNSQDDESPWSCGVRVEFKKNDKLNAKTLMCIGTC
jgi:hypothetical protein